MQNKRGVLLSLAVLLAVVLLAREARAVYAGNLDTAFTASTDGVVYAAVVQPDDKIIIGGTFANVNGVAHANLARLNADGSLDASYAATTDGSVNAMTFQPGGQLILGGTFTTVNGAAAGLLARLNTDGTLDTSFVGSTTSPASGSAVNRLVCEGDGKILVESESVQEVYLPPRVGGTVGIPTYGLGRLNADGSGDTSFQSQTSTPQPFDAIAVQPDGKVLLAQHTTGNGLLMRLNTDGSIDGTFAMTTTVAFSDLYALLVQPDGRIVAGGFTPDDSLTVFQMNADGSLDPTFHISTGTAGVDQMLLQPDGKIVLGGGLTQIDGSDQAGVARLATDGTLDNGFVSPANMDGSVDALALQSDGNVFAGGTFNRVGGVIHKGLALFYGADTAVPQITSYPGVIGQVGVPFSYQITTDSSGTSFAANAVYSIYAGLDKPLPAGLSLDPASGMISGTPAREGDYVVDLEATNAAGSSILEIPLTIDTAAGFAHPSFFTGEEPLSNGVYYLKFFYSGSQPTNYFSYYSYLSDPHYIYHFDLGYEYVLDAKDGKNGVYLYDFASNDFFYTSPTFPFPYLYDFGLNSTIYYYADPNDPERYNTNGVRYFYVFSTGQTITK